MAMRNEPKDVYSAVYDTIMLGWEPLPVKPLVLISYQVRYTSRRSDNLVFVTGCLLFFHCTNSG